MNYDQFKGHVAAMDKAYDPQAAALQMALQPNLNSLDELLAAIRALQCHADQEINRLLEQNAELLTALERIDALPSSLAGDAWAIARKAIASAKPNTRTDADVADDRRALIDELPDDPDYTGGGR
jgi:hypothetical protein